MKEENEAQMIAHLNGIAKSQKRIACCLVVIVVVILIGVGCHVASVLNLVPSA